MISFEPKYNIQHKRWLEYLLTYNNKDFYLGVSSEILVFDSDIKIINKRFNSKDRYNAYRDKPVDRFKIDHPEVYSVLKIKGIL